MFVEGRLRTREYEAKNRDGKRTEIIASRVRFLGAPPAEKVAATTTEEPLPLADDLPF